MKKGKAALEEFLQHELEDYSQFEYEIFDETCEEDSECYRVEFSINGEYKNTVWFYYDLAKEILEVELGEDNLEEVDNYSNRVRYFWMALLW